MTSVKLSENSQFDCTSCVEETPGNDHCGLLMLDGNLGRENWRFRLGECAVGLQCDLVSYDSDIPSRLNQDLPQCVSLPYCVFTGLNYAHCVSLFYTIFKNFGTMLVEKKTVKEIWE